MSAANELAALWAQSIWRATWQGGLFVLVVWALCRLIRRIPAWARYWLWWVACVQMLVRLAAISPISLPVLPSHHAAPVLSAVAARDSIGDARIVHQALPFIVRTPAKESEPASYALALSLVWAGGAAVCAIASGRKLLRTRRLLQRASSLRGTPVFEIVEEICIEHGFRSPAAVASPSAPCPMLCGLLRPTIVFPMEFLESASEPQLRMAIAHELAHLRRGDLWFAIAPALVQVLFFFHPLAWLAAREAAAACEEVCDYEALRITGGSPAAYARLLLYSAQNGASLAALGTAFGYRLLQRRIKMIHNSTRINPSRYRRAFTALIVLGALAALPWNVTAQTETPKGQRDSYTPSIVVKDPSDSYTATKPATIVAATKSSGVTKTVAAKAAGKAHAALPQTKSSGTKIVALAKVGKVNTDPTSKALTTGIAVTPTAAVRRSDRYDLPELLPAGQEGRGGIGGGSSMVLVQRDPSDRDLITIEGGQLKAALALIFKAKHAEFVIKNDVPTEPVTFSINLKETGLESAISLVLKGVREHVTWSREDNVYIVSLAKEN